MTNKIIYAVTAVVLAALLLLLSDPFMVWMPAPLQMVILLAVTVSVLVWAGFVMCERAQDEREAVHKMQAGRIAYLAGIAVLTIALVFQGFAHDIDPWVPAALAVMVITKLAARWYTERYR